MKHYNPTISQNLNRIFNFKGESTEDVYPEILPVIPITGIINIIRSASLSSGATTNIYTTPTDKDFYIDALCVSLAKDVNATTTALTITATIDGVSVAILSIACTTLTLERSDKEIYFEKPIKIDRNTVIALSSGTNVATFRFSCNLYGHVEEVTKGS